MEKWMQKAMKYAAITKLDWQMASNKVMIFCRKRGYFLSTYTK